MKVIWTHSGTIITITLFTEQVFLTYLLIIEYNIVDDQLYI